MALPTPFYQDSLVTIYQGDAQVLLPEFSIDQFNWGIIDPPHRDGDPNILNPLMAQVRPLMDNVCVHVAEMTHMVPILGTGPQRNDIVASNCSFLVDGVQQAAARINDPDMKVTGWSNVVSTRLPTSVLDCFLGSGGWILLAAKRLGIPSVGIGNDINYLQQSSARIALG